MTEKQIVVPEEMLNAAVNAAILKANVSILQVSPKIAEDIREQFKVALEAALRWLSENPRVPTDEQMLALQDSFRSIPEAGEKQMLIAVEWQRICWLKPEPEVPESIKDLLHQGAKGLDLESEYNAGILEAYRRGQKNPLAPKR